MAGSELERAMSAEGWTIPRWRTSSNAYGNFYAKQTAAPRVQKDINYNMQPDCWESSYNAHFAPSVSTAGSAGGANTPTAPRRPRPATAAGIAPGYYDLALMKQAHNVFQQQARIYGRHEETASPRIDIIGGHEFQEHPPSCSCGVCNAIARNYPKEQHPENHAASSSNSPYVSPAYANCLQDYIKGLSLKEKHKHDCDCGYFCDDIPTDGTPYLLRKPKPLVPRITFDKMAKERQREMDIDRCLTTKRKNGDWSHDTTKRTQYYETHDIKSERQFYPLEENKRYNHYKYYGIRGNGAKSSRGNRYPLAHKAPFSNRTKYQ